MKNDKLRVIIILLSLNSYFLQSYAQAPSRFNYQAVVRNANNTLLLNQPVGIRISILQGSASGAAVYVETHTATTSNNGQVNVEIGGGNLIAGSMAGINWSSGNFFLKMETDVSGGTNYSLVSTVRFQSVPYAIYAATSGNGMANGTANNQIMYWNGSSWVMLNPGVNGQVLTICNGVLTWTSGGQCPGNITSINCSASTVIGTLLQGVAANGVSVSVPYAGGNGGVYSGQTVSSTGVSGLTATLNAGIFASGSGSLTYIISGTPAGIGTANFSLDVGGKSCILSISVSVASGTITSLDCSTVSQSGTMTQGTSASGVSFTVSYTGGNGGAHNGQTVTSTGVTGLTAKLAPGIFSNGSGNLRYDIVGTPAGNGTATFVLNIGGKSCPVSRSVFGIGTTGSSVATCGAQSVHNQSVPYGTVTDQSGNVYKTVVIGTQEWMAENLKASHYRNGDLIPRITSPSTWSGLTTGAVCWYNNDSATYNCPYGKLYNWYAVSDSRNLCPIGWHVPSDADINILQNALGGWGVAGGKLKTQGITYWAGGNTGGTNSSGFSGLPNGLQGPGGGFNTIGALAHFWTSTGDVGKTDAVLYRFHYAMPNMERYVWDNRHGFAVRCVRD